MRHFINYSMDDTLREDIIRKTTVSMGEVTGEYLVVEPDKSQQGAVYKTEARFQCMFLADSIVKNRCLLISVVPFSTLAASSTQEVIELIRGRKLGYFTLMKSNFICIKHLGNFRCLASRAGGLVRRPSVHHSWFLVVFQEKSVIVAMNRYRMYEKAGSQREGSLSIESTEEDRLDDCLEPREQIDEAPEAALQMLFGLLLLYNGEILKRFNKLLPELETDILDE